MDSRGRRCPLPIIDLAAAARGGRRRHRDHPARRRSRCRRRRGGLVPDARVRPTRAAHRWTTRAMRLPGADRSCSVRCAAISSAAASPNAARKRASASASTWYSCVPTVSRASVASRLPISAHRCRPSSHDRPPRKPARNASPTPGGIGLRVLGDDRNLQLRPVRRLQPHALASERGHQDADPGTQLRIGPAALLQQQAVLVVVAEQVGGALAQIADLRAVHPRQLLRRVSGERISPLAALRGVARHRRGIVGADHDQVQPPDPGRHRLRARSPAPRSSRPDRTTRSGTCPGQWCTGSARCGRTR